MSRKIEVLADREALVQRGAILTQEKIEAAIAARGRCTLALAGGSTPKPLYQTLAQQNFPWEKIHIFWGDERYVPPDHPDSNERMAREAWLDRVEFPSGNIHPMPTNGGDPAADAAAHEQELQTFFQVGAGEFPVFDLILLGIGDDGHTASLFPHTPALTVRDRLVTVGNKDGSQRLTFSAPLINRARCVMFLVAGESKRPALREIFAPTGDENTYPARLIAPEGEVWWLLDEAAGTGLA